MKPSVTPEAVREALGAYQWVNHPALPGARNHRKAGVLVPISWSPQPKVIATLRPTQLSQHGGEICFPGGRPEPGDEDLFHTASREAQEELGITNAEYLGRLSSFPLFSSDYRIEPFVARVSEDSLEPNPDEVAQVLIFDPGELFSIGRVEALPYIWQGEMRLSPIFRHGDLTMYGATALAYWELLQVLAPVFGAQIPELFKSDSSWEDVVVPGIYDKVSMKIRDRLVEGDSQAK